MKRDLIYQGRILTLTVLDDKWEVVEHSGAVAVLALREGPAGREALGVEQRRPAIGARTWELPAGLIDAGETPAEAALRELSEEAQLSGELDLLTQFYTSPGFTNEKIHLFLARDLFPAPGVPDEDEDLTLSWREVNTLWRDIRAGRVYSSGPTVTGLSYALGLNAAER